MNKKLMIFLITIVSILIIISTIIGFYIIKKVNTQNNNDIEISEKIVDECTEEYLQMASEETEKANSEDEKVSPNTTMILKKYYTKCNHTIEEQIELPKELINLTKDEVEEEYQKWEIEEFSSEKIVLKKEYDEECGEHYVLRDNIGMIAVYKIDEKGEETLIEETEIATEYLTEEDLSKIQEGIKINGKKELNKVLEDFE